MTDSQPRAPGDDCGGCALSGRREFLADAVRAAAAALATLGLSPAAARATPLEWVGALSVRLQERIYPVPSSDGVQIDRDGEVILARSGRSVWAFALACPHQNTALRWDARANRFQCPKHKSRYRPDGTFIEGRATRGLDRYAVRLVGTTIAVDVDKLYQEDTDLAAWKQAVVIVA
jgi:nitrite reductase/ring-hydroxylating ferredoxin subunit